MKVTSEVNSDFLLKNQINSGGGRGLIFFTNFCEKYFWSKKKIL